jgi:hypothetical protein
MLRRRLDEIYHVRSIGYVIVAKLKSRSCNGRDIAFVEIALALTAKTGNKIFF